jgi:hypothetical protein
LEEKVGERRPFTMLDVTVPGDIPAGCRTNISGVLAENDDLLSLPSPPKEEREAAPQLVRDTWKV